MVCENVKPGDVVLTLGAGNVEELGSQILGALKKRAAIEDATAVGA